MVCLACSRAEREADQKAKEEQRAQRELETKGAPFSLELMRCDQLLLWCKQYERPAEEAAAPATAAPLELDGMVAFKKKDADSNDVFTTSRSKGVAHILLCECAVVVSLMRTKF